MRRLTFLATLFVLLFAVVLPASAAPKGDARDSDVGKKLFNFNVIAVPNGDWVVDDSECTNNGKRIFFEQGDGNTLGTIKWALYPDQNQSFDIQDCDGTGDSFAEIWANELQRFYVMIKLVGPKTSSLNVVCTDVIDYLGVDDLCLYSGGITRNSTTKIMENVAEGQYEEVLWEFSGDWKIFQVLIYEKL